MLSIFIFAYDYFIRLVLKNLKPYFPSNIFKGVTMTSQRFLMVQYGLCVTGLNKHISLKYSAINFWLIWINASRSLDKDRKLVELGNRVRNIVGDFKIF